MPKSPAKHRSEGGFKTPTLPKTKNMQQMISHDPGLSKFKPLPWILCHDDFDRGTNGWVDLTPNFRFENFEPRKGPVDLAQWGPTMLSTASFRYVGTHGSMDGIYSLKLATRPVAAPASERPATGSQGVAIKRMTLPPDLWDGLLQYELWFAYKPEQDRVGFSEKDVRAFGFFFDIQDERARYHVTMRYLNSVDGKPARRWQLSRASNLSEADWEYGTPGWTVPGIDNIWFGQRYSDGSTDGFQDVPGGEQQLCYNESDDKINWLYARMLVDLGKQEYVELQCGNQTFDLRGTQPTLAKPYANIHGLLNPALWIEADTDRRVFLFVDSVVISAAPRPS
jgi:hypothetical protein